MVPMSKEVAVLGAGMVGTSAALALQARGFDVLLLDRASPGSETSYGNAGFIQAEACEPYALPRELGTLLRIVLKRDNSVDWDFAGLIRQAPALLAYWYHSAPARHRAKSRAYAALIRRATRDHERWITASSAQNLIRKEGYRVIFRDPAKFEQQARQAEILRGLYGLDYGAEDSAALAAAEPALRIPLAGAVRWNDTWTCNDPGALVKAYVDLFVRQGGALLQAECQGLTPSGRGWRIASSAGMLEAAQVVLALGPWSPQTLSPLGYRITMVRKRGYHMHCAYPPVSADVGAKLLGVPIMDAELGAVYSPMRAGLRIATGADLSARSAQPIPRQIRRAHAAARELLDLGEPLEEGRLWSGIRPCMPDMLPVVGAAPRHNGLWFNFGHGHQGFTLGPTTGHLLADMMAGELEAETLAFSPARLRA